MNRRCGSRYPRAPLAALAMVAGILLAGAAVSQPAPAFGATPARAGAVRSAKPPALEATASRAGAGGSASHAVLSATSGTTLPTASNPTTATTVVPIQKQLPAPPVTLPLTTRQASTRLNPLLAKLSIAGFALFLLLLLVQFILTRPRRRGRWTL